MIRYMQTLYTLGWSFSCIIAGILSDTETTLLIYFIGLSLYILIDVAGKEEELK